MPENPNEYDDARYLQGVEALGDAIGLLWEAGASEDEIMDQVRRAVEAARDA